MKRSIWLLGLLTSVLLACEKDDAQPYAELPEKIRALVDREDCSCDTKLELIKWRDQLLFHPYNRGPACDMRYVFYDQEGNEVELKISDNQHFTEDFELIKTWSCGM